jgi:8-oxo-dGTP pyrophosphatase MutT (NUDIX family)
MLSPKEVCFDEKDERLITFCVYFYRAIITMNNDRQLICGGFVIIHHNHVLFVSTHKGNWGFPKGKKEYGETLEQCAY